MTGPEPAEAGPTAPGPTDAGPSDPPVRRHRGRKLVTRTLVRAWDDNIFSEAAAAAFWQTLSLPPLLLGLFGILSYVGDFYGPDTITAVQEQVVELVGRVFSREAVEDIIAPTVADILTNARAEVVSIGFVISLWSGSSAMSSFVDAITRAHEQYLLRNPVWQRLLALLLYAGRAGDGDRGAADRGDRARSGPPGSCRSPGSRRRGRCWTSCSPPW